MPQGQEKGLFMAIEAKFASSQEAKKQGWYSRRHKTSEAHADNFVYKSSKARKNARRDGAAMRNKLRASRTPQQQMLTLNQRLGTDAYGIGMDAKKERGRLAILIVAKS